MLGVRVKLRGLGLKLGLGSGFEVGVRVQKWGGRSRERSGQLGRGN